MGGPSSLGYPVHSLMGVGFVRRSLVDGRRDDTIIDTIITKKGCAVLLG